MPKVPLSMDTLKKCICPQCPVQTSSECSKKKMEKAKEMMASMKGEPKVPAPEDIAGMYCSTGIAACDDLDFSQMCICGSCPLWDEFNLPSLEPKGYYCRDGVAK